MKRFFSVLSVAAAVLWGTAASADTISGTIVDLARYVTGTTSATMMNTDMMMRMMANGTMPAGMVTGGATAGGMMGGATNGGMMGGSAASPAPSDEHHAAVPTGSPQPGAAGGEAGTMPMAAAGMQIGRFMQSCHTIGLVTKAGTAYLLTTTGSVSRPLCGDVGRSATVTGTVHLKGGMRAIVASSVQVH